MTPSPPVEPELETILIVGAGLAGAKAAEALRERGYGGAITIVGAEPELPYERPPLSKGYLAGTSARADTQVQPGSFYAEQDIEVLAGATASALDPAARRVELADGTTLGYDRLLIATGAVPRRPPLPGADLDGVHLLRTLADADALRAVLDRGARLRVSGAGWIGSEVAASARTRGSDVTLVEQAAVPLERVLGHRLGTFFADLHRGHGVDLRTGTGVEAIEGAGRVERVRLSDGSVVDCDAVLLSVGVAPDTAFAASGGLAIDDGIVVDARLRTSAPEVFAAGDVASAHHPRYGRHIRVEHWANALNQGTFAGGAMLGDDATYSRLPYFFSDQYDAGMEYVGLHAPGDRLVVRGEPGRGASQALWLDAGDRVTAGMHVDDWDAIDGIRELVERGEPVADPERV